jgi:hypothetical protein
MQQRSHTNVNTSDRCLISIPTLGLACSKPESRSPAVGESPQAAEEKSWMNRDGQPRQARIVTLTRPLCKFNNSL